MKSMLLFTLTCISVAQAEADILIETELLKLDQTGNVLTLSAAKIGRQPVSATIDLLGDVQQRLIRNVSNPLWGRGREVVLKHGNETTGITLYEDNSFAHLETRVSNPGREFLSLRKLKIAEFTFDLRVDSSKLNTLGTPGLRPAVEESNSYTYSALVDPASRRGVVTGWLTQRQGLGIMLSSMKDAREGLERYADDIAKVYDIKLKPKPNVYCTWYHKVIHKTGCSNEKLLTENATFAEQHLKPFGLDVMQIDDHWQSESTKEIPYKAPKGSRKGPVKLFAEARPEKFPGGMAAMADTLREKGFIPGIWFIPFSGHALNPNFDAEIFARDRNTGAPFNTKTWSGTCIDVTHPKGEAFLRQRAKRMYDWGYRYFKLDGLHTGALSRNIYVNREYKGVTFGEAELYDKDMTFVQALRHGMGLVREEAPDAFLLGCCAVQNMVSFAPAFGQVDAMRVGPDNGGAAGGRWGSVLKAPMFAGNLYFLHNRVWYNDPDPVYVRLTAPMSHVQCMLSFVAVTGMMNTTSAVSSNRVSCLKQWL